jgi:integrase
MKAGREHRIPLGPRAIEILKRARELAAGSEFVFPGRSPERPMSNMVFSMILRRMKMQVTAHGFRSAFRDWAAEQTNYPREVCEMALAHAIADKTEAAYRRGDLFEKRRELMDAWERFAAARQANM